VVRGTSQGRALVEIGFRAAILILTAAAPFTSGQMQGPTQVLQLSISAESPGVVEPFPVRLVLHFHNSGNQPLWLFKPVRDAAAISQSSLGPNPGASTIAVHLESASSSPGSPSTNPAVGTLLRTPGMPRPKLIPVAAGGSYQENLALNIAPATRQTGQGSEPVWGAYRLTAIYSASYANGVTINNNLGVDVWQGSVSSNQLPIQLQLAPAGNEGTISGTVLNRHMQQDWGILVSLSDSNQHVIAQRVTGNDGGFSFSQLPYGRYWVTVRTPGSDVDTGFFEHADLSASKPDARLKLIMLSPEDYDARQLLHKPVLFRIRDGAGNPVPAAELHILWSNGPVMENLKVETDANGLAEINLIPGSNYVTIRKRHCPKQDEMANVAPGSGIDGFVMTFECEKQ
jgi:hypothetical protein